MGRGGVNPDLLTDEQFRAWCNIAPTRAQVEAQQRDDQREKDIARKAEFIAAWRARHPEATCRDATAFLLAVMEERWGA